MSIPRALGGLIVVMSIVNTASAQQVNSYDLIRSYFQTYLHREPGPEEVANWVRTVRNERISHWETQARFMASDEYFARFGNQIQGVIVGYYQDLLRRNPTASEVQVWLREWTNLRGNRIQFARQFVQAAQTELNTRPPEPIGTGQLVAQLTAAAELLDGAVQVELGGHPRGRQVRVRANALESACREFRRVFRPPLVTGRERDAFADVELSFLSLQQSMSGLQFVAPRTSLHLSQIGDILQTLRRDFPAPPVIRPPVAGLDGALLSRVTNLTFGLSRSSQNLANATSSESFRDPKLVTLARDVEFFASQVEAFRSTLRLGLPIADAQSSFLRLRDLGNGIGHQTRRLNVSAYVANSWVAVASDLRGLGEALGVPVGPGIDAGGPVLVNPPTVGIPGWPINPGTNVPGGNPSVMAADIALAQVDAFLAGTQPLFLAGPTVPRLVAQARALRGSLAEFRADAANNVPRAYLIARMVAVNTNMTLTRNLRTQTASIVPNVPAIEGVAVAVQQLNQTFESTR